MPKHIRRGNATRSSVLACVEHVFGHEKRPMASVALAKFAPPAGPPWPTSATLSDASFSMNEDGPRPGTAQKPEIPAPAGQKVGKTNATTNAQTKTLAKRGIHPCIPFKTKPMLLKASSLRMGAPWRDPHRAIQPPAQLFIIVTSAGSSVGFGWASLRRWPPGARTHWRLLTAPSSRRAAQKGELRQGVGCSRGGRGIKVHTAVDREGRPLRIKVAGAQTP